VAAVVAALLVSSLTGCRGGQTGVVSGLGGSAQTPSSGAASETASDTASGAAPVGTVWSGAQDRAVRALLAARAEAVLDHDRTAFLRTVAPGSGRREQAAWFTRVTSLPLVRYRLDLGAHDTKATDPHRAGAAVTEEVQLSGFDPAPVDSDHHFDFQEAGGRWRVVEDAVDRSQLNDVPWDFPGTKIALGDHVAVVVDRGTANRAQELVSDVEAARTRDNSVLPPDVAQLGDVIVLAFSNTAGLRAEGFDLSEIQGLGGIALPVYGADKVVELRALIAPVMLTPDDPVFLPEVIRHELTHVALMGYTGPRWLSEGIAEYVAWFGEPRIYLSRSAIDEAHQGGMTSMPYDAYFYTGDDTINYGIGWFSLKVLASLDGRDEPFRLLQAVTAAKLVHTEDVDNLLQQRYGFGLDELARRAGGLIASSFTASP
jgi:hypothetical protein